MTIRARDIGKRYGQGWVFRGLNIEIATRAKLAITGKNGSGKSTLLQILGGYLTPSEGVLTLNDRPIDPGALDAAFVGPYTEVIEEMTLRELLAFHSHFKKARSTFDEMADQAALPLDKSIVDFSTGMKQRAKLITALYFENAFIFMDEPTSNLDNDGFDWWKAEIEKTEATLLLASNDPREISICAQKISL